MNPDDFEKSLQRQPLRQIPQEWRSEILRAANTKVAQPAIEEPRLPWLLRPWHELFWAARRVWLGFAVIWIAIVAINLADTETPGKAETAMKIPSDNILLTWQQQQRLLTELNNSESTDSDKPKVNAPKPRSERRALQATV